MIKLNNKFKTKLIEKFNRIKESFNDDILLSQFPLRMPVGHYMTIRRIKDTDFDNINDIKLIMLCGVCDFAFNAGDYGYTTDQNLSINELNDLIFELKTT